ncbi:M-phase phosphoprotein 6 [Neodiprion pinetum]|uniref:M-phase phosphoprotein 6 n=1 Tax=Neodiprion pinetum TaxID=441929 RepID=UPI001EDE51C6|nr:M-phase phosphoprotein 6 [Neodiprion pinetum]XP_046468923.1 M-phase phosphoprotein 6 [Neodiprion pinetum]XP_046468924.1 M-phase phosphoprotein 6 [Neodiprion pinetum]XP_046468925.1 M-phase phosphoprotein 6 [Neodiprion pinetum]
MTAREVNKTKLSKGILEMKFMKRTKEKVEKQLFQEEGKEYFGAQLTNHMKKGSDKFIIEPSFVFCEGLLDGRVSFRGMNPEIERLMELEEEAKQALTRKQNETEITDEQMAKHYRSSAVDTMAKKFRTKHENKKYVRDDSIEIEPVEKKPKFLKPSD